MKKLILGMIVLASSSAFADSLMTVNLSRENPTTVIKIQDQKFDPILIDQPYQTTCYMDVPYTHQIACTSTYIGFDCDATGWRWVEDTKSVPYACTENRKVQTGVTLVKTFNHQIEVSLKNAVNLANNELQVSVVVSENTIKASLINSYSKEILLYHVELISNNDKGSSLDSFEKISIDFGPSESALQAFSSIRAQNPSLDQNGLKFELTDAKDIERLLNINLELLEHRGIFNKIYSVFNVEMELSTVISASSNNDTLVSLAANQLGSQEIKGKKHDLNLSLKFNTKNILNASDFKSLLMQKNDIQLKNIKP